MEDNNIPCIQADITNLSFPKDCVDFIVSTHTIEHLPDLQAIEDEGDSYDSIEEIWPDYPTDDDYLWNEDEY